MPNAFRSALEQLASTFVTGVLAAIRSASLEDLAVVSEGPAARVGRPRGRSPASSPAKPSSKKRGRRSPADFEQALKTVVDAVKASKTTGMRSEQIQKATGLSRKQIPAVIKKALAAKTLRRTGAKRSTRYFVR